MTSVNEVDSLTLVVFMIQFNHKSLIYSTMLLSSLSIIIVNRSIKKWG